MKKWFLFIILAVFMASCNTVEPIDTPADPPVEDTTLTMACWPQCMYDDCISKWGSDVEKCAHVFESGSVQNICACLVTILELNNPVEVAAELAAYSVACGTKCIFNTEEKMVLYNEVKALCDEWKIAYPENLNDLIVE